MIYIIDGIQVNKCKYGKMYNIQHCKQKMEDLKFVLKEEKKRKGEKENRRHTKQLLLQ